MLDKILTPKRAEIARMLSAPPLGARRTPMPGVATRLRRSTGAPLRLIAEVKFRSPSAGELSRALDAPARALAYARAGASMISVLTDELFFGGSFDHLAACRDRLESEFGAARPPLLCKEFVLHTIQLDRALDAGADAVLLIARILSPEELGRLARETRARGLEPLVEVATLDELAAALASEARLIGVNARDLDTLRMDPEGAEVVLARAAETSVAIHLSGLASPDDVARISKGGADAALVGEALMRQDDPSELLRAMVLGARTISHIP